MNKIKNCPVCGKLYIDTGTRMCRDCYEKELEDENVAARYVRDNPKSSVKEICEATGVKERVVLRMIKSGRFVEAGAEVTYPCESCGKPITRGRLCDKCSKDIIKQVGEHEQRKERERQAAPKHGGMYVRRLPKTGDRD